MFLAKAPMGREEGGSGVGDRQGKKAKLDKPLWKWLQVCNFTTQ